MAHLVFPGKERPPRYGSSRVFRLAPGSPRRARGAQWGRGGPPTPLARVGSADAREKALISAPWLYDNLAANAQRRPAPPWDSTQPGLILFGRKNSQALQTRRAPLEASAAGTPTTLSKFWRGGCQALRFHLRKARGGSGELWWLN